MSKGTEPSSSYSQDHGQTVGSTTPIDVSFRCPMLGQSQKTVENKNYAGPSRRFADENKTEPLQCYLSSCIVSHRDPVHHSVAHHSVYQVPRSHRTSEQMNTAAKFFNRVAGISATVGIGSSCLQECIYDGASRSYLHIALFLAPFWCLVSSIFAVIREQGRELSRTRPLCF